MNTLLILLSLLNAGDAGSTLYARQHVRGFYERDPIARPFVNLPTAGYFAAVGGGIVGEWQIARVGQKRHPKLTKVLVIAGIGIEGYLIQNNLRLKK